MDSNALFRFLIYIIKGITGVGTQLLTNIDFTQGEYTYNTVRLETRYSLLFFYLIERWICLHERHANKSSILL